MRRIATLIVLGFSAVSFGQQMPQFSQYQRNQYMVNPGAAGMYDFLDVTLGGRMQWVGFSNSTGDNVAPMSSYLYASSALSKKPKVRYNPALRTSSGPIRNPEIETGKLKHALGGMLIADQYGAFRQLEGAVTYAIHLPVATKYNLSFGVNLGVSNRAFLKDRAQTLDVMDPTVGYVDDVYAEYANNANTYTMDVGAGLFFYSEKLFIGISSDQLTRDFVSFGNVNANFDPNMHYYLTAGYKIDVSDNLSIMPSVLAKYMTPAPVSIEGTVQLEYKEWLWFGLSYRHADAVVGMAGLNISERFKFGYSYDFSINRFNNYSSGGHEVVLGLMLGR